MGVHEARSNDLVLAVDDVDVAHDRDVGSNLGNFVAADEYVRFDTGGMVVGIVQDDRAVLQQER